MRPFVDIGIETTNPTAAVNRLHSMGLSKGDGIRVFSGMLESITGLYYFTFRVWQDRVHVIPENNNPTFTLLWRSDRQDPPVPWPEVEVTKYDIDGNPDGTTMQGCGRIA